MRSRILKALVLLVVLLAMIGGALYQFFGLRVVLDGGGRPHLRFVESSGDQAARVERHRQAQREGYVAAPSPPESSAASSAPVRSSATESTLASSPRATAPVAGEVGMEWPDFRGERRDGTYQLPLLTSWPQAGLTPVWKQPSGAGYASFVIAGGRAFTIEQRGSQEVVAAYEVGTGRELWKNGWTTEFRETMGGDGPRATPTWAGGRVYALGAEGELRALDELDGHTIWRRNILQDASAANLQWGMSASPLVFRDLVVVQPGGGHGRSVVAYDRKTGNEVWAALDDRQSYASPMLATLAGIPQILVFTADRLTALGLDGSGPLWQYDWPGPNGINAAQPLVIGENRVFISSGYGMGAAVVEIAKGESGLSVREVWRNTRMKNRFASSVLHRGFIYGFDEAILACLDAATGELKWKGGRYGYGQLLLAGGHLIVLTEEGELALVTATPDRHEELARFPVLSGKTWNVPAIGGGFLLVRNLAEMAAFDLRSPR
jgi:outer membrane protein assembly factor BamB